MGAFRLYYLYRYMPPDERGKAAGQVPVWSIWSPDPSSCHQYGPLIMMLQLGYPRRDGCVLKLFEKSKTPDNQLNQ